MNFCPPSHPSFIPELILNMDETWISMDHKKIRVIEDLIAKVNAVWVKMNEEGVW